MLTRTLSRRGVRARPISGASVEDLKKKRDQSAAARATVRAKALRCESSMCPWRWAFHAGVSGGRARWAAGAGGRGRTVWR